MGRSRKYCFILDIESVSSLIYKQLHVNNHIISTYFIAYLIPFSF